MYLSCSKRGQLSQGRRPSLDAMYVALPSRPISCSSNVTFPFGLYEPVVPAAKLAQSAPRDQAHSCIQSPKSSPRTRPSCLPRCARRPNQRLGLQLPERSWKSQRSSRSSLPHHSPLAPAPHVVHPAPGVVGLVVVLPGWSIPPRLLSLLSPPPLSPPVMVVSVRQDRRRVMRLFLFRLLYLEPRDARQHADGFVGCW